MQQWRMRISIAYLSSQQQDMNNLIQGTTENFKDLVSTQDKVILVDFYAEWCGPCRNLSPVLDKIAEKYSEVMVVKVDVDKNGEICRSEPYQVRGIPQMFFVKNGEVLKKMTGFQTMDNIEAALDTMLN